MKRHVFLDASPYSTLLRVEDATPECGTDFCDACGDCLACDGDGTCFHSTDGEHSWVVYEQPEPPPTDAPTTAEDAT